MFFWRGRRNLGWWTLETSASGSDNNQECNCDKLLAVRLKGGRETKADEKASETGRETWASEQGEPVLQVSHPPLKLLTGKKKTGAVSISRHPNNQPPAPVSSIGARESRLTRTHPSGCWQDRAQQHGERNSAMGGWLFRTIARGDVTSDARCEMGEYFGRGRRVPTYRLELGFAWCEIRPGSVFGCGLG